MEKLRTLKGHQEFFFRNGNGTPKPLTPRWIQREFSRLVEEARIEDLHFHDLRRTFGCTLVDLGVDLLTIQNAKAHKSIKSTLCYVRPNEDKVDDAFDRIGEFWSKNEVKSDSGAEPISSLNTSNKVS